MERNKQTPGVNGIMDISEAADYLHIKKWTLYRLVKRGKIPGIKVGGQWRFKKEVLDEMFKGKGLGFVIHKKQNSTDRYEGYVDIVQGDQRGDEPQKTPNKKKQ